VDRWRVQGAEKGGDFGQQPASKDEHRKGVDQLYLASSNSINQNRWVAEESKRSLHQWQPQRQPPPAAAAVDDDAAAAAAAEFDPGRLVGFLRIEPCLFALFSPAAFRRLVLGCCELLGAPLRDWCSSNAPTPAQQQRVTAGGVSGAAAASDGGRHGSNAAAGEAEGQDVLEIAQIGATAQAFAQAVASANSSAAAPWYSGSSERFDFVRRLLDALVASPACAALREELVSALLLLHTQRPGIEQPEAPTGAAASAALGGKQQQPLSSQQAEFARSAAKALLCRHRDDLLLFAAYARLEAAAGNTKAARKVYESALSMGGAAAAGGGNTSGALARVAVEFADFELAIGGAAAPLRAEAAVTAALSGTPYKPPPSKPTNASSSSSSSSAAAAAGGGGSLSMVGAAARMSARRSFQDHIPQLLATAGGALDAGGAAAVAAAALLELLIGATDGRVAAGVAAARSVLRNVASAVPEVVRRGSVYHERLAVRACGLTVAVALGSLPPCIGGGGGAPATGRAGARGGGDGGKFALISPAEARSALQDALRLYPNNPSLLALLTRLETASFTLTRLRRELHALCERAPSPALWLVTLQSEALRPGGRGRLRSMLEAALSGNVGGGALADAPRALPLPPLKSAAASDDAASASDQHNLPPEQQGEQQLAFWDASPTTCAACPTLWLLHICWERSLHPPDSPHPSDSAHKLLLRAVHACPGAKRLWLGGLGRVAGGLGPRELSGLVGAMGERCMVRTEVLEVMLAALDSEGLAVAVAAGGG